MTTELARRIDRVLTMLLGALFLTGAAWCSVALSVGAWPDFRSVPWFVATLGGAYILGGVVLWWGWTRGRLDVRLAVLVVAMGSVAVAFVATSSGPVGATALGGLYTYVTAISFLWFSLPVALGQLVFAGASYAAALQMAGAEGAPATWLVAMGIAAGGAGLVGALASRLRRLYIDEAELAVKLREADELKSTFLQAVSHELRTPLAAVRGYTETLDHHLPRLADDQVGFMLGRLRGASERLDSLLSDLLDVERLQRGELQPRRAPCHVAPLIATVVDELDAAGGQIELDVEECVAHLEAPKVERIVANLVGNAVKHTPAGTRVRVTARPLGRNGLDLRVADEGPGLEPGLGARMFRPFEQGQPSSRAASPGIGLGLAIVERFVELHGGEITTSPGLGGHGVSFNVLLPGGDGPEPATDAAGASDLAASN